MIDLAPLFADAGDVIKILLFILIIGAGGIGHLITKIKEAQENARRREQRAKAQQMQQAQGRQMQAQGQQMQARGQQMQAQGQPKQGGLEDEIGAFLRGAAERRAAGGGGQAPGARPQAGPVAPRPGGRPAPRPVVQPRPVRPAQPVRPADQAPVDVVLAEEAEPARPPREQRDQDRLRHLSTQVGRDAPRPEAAMGGHVHDVFDHRLGQLEGQEGDTAEAALVQEASSPEDRIEPMPAAAAAGFTALFADVNNLRQAILIHEILKRPEERWNF